MDLVEQLRKDADEIEGWGAGNEAANVRRAADQIEKFRAALQPFAQAASQLQHLPQDSTICGQPLLGVGAIATVADFRNAQTIFETRS